MTDNTNPSERRDMAPDDIFKDQPDDDKPVSRGEMRQIVLDLRHDLKWAVIITVVAGQGLNHVQLPPIAGFIGGAAVVILGIAKLAIAR